jgi:hypothetical protein
MSDLPPKSYLTNPFSTRYVRPGALPCLFDDGETADSVVARLRGQKWWGEIIGPHGSGKSTLVAALLDGLQAVGRTPLLHTLHDGVVRFPGLTPGALCLHPVAVLMIDGYEQLSRWQRFRVRRSCRRAGCGLVVTAHRPTGLPELYRTRVTPGLAGRIFAELTNDRRALASLSELSDRLARRNGNLREAFFDLYDLHECRRRDAAQTGILQVAGSLQEGEFGPGRISLPPSQSGGI